jgi:hypothetical protein
MYGEVLAAVDGHDFEVGRSLKDAEELQHLRIFLTYVVWNGELRIACKHAVYEKRPIKKKPLP